MEFCDLGAVNIFMLTRKRVHPSCTEKSCEADTTPVTFRFSGLPSNAVVRSVAIDPGRGIVNNNNKNILGAVIFSKIEVTSPKGTTADIAWKASGMTDSAHFLQEKGAGNWTALVYGTNIARPTGNPTLDLRYVGSLSYKSVQMTISYVLE